MASVTTYLNFTRDTEAAFAFYKSVFGTEYSCPIMRYKDAPPCGDQPLPAEDGELVMHVSLPILAGHVLMGTDSPEAFCPQLVAGNNISINLQPDTREETDQLFAALSEGGTVEMPLQDMFWGAYWGTLTDRFGIHWMFNCPTQ